VTVETPAAPPRVSRILEANSDFVAPDVGRGTRGPGARLLLGLGLLVGILAASLIFGGRLLVQAPAPEPVRPFDASPTLSEPSQADQLQSDDDVGGNAIVQSPCLDVGGGHCLDADPRLREAVDLLRGTSKGPDLLTTAAAANVHVRIGRAPTGALAAFRSRTRTVTMDTRLMQYSARGQAAVLAHELRHVADWSKVGGMFANNTLACYNTEASAFQTEAAVWSELRGDRPPADRLESQVEEIAQGVKRGDAKFWLELGGDYLEE
jgi:hypothetical protein